MPICMELYVITPQNESYKIKSAVTCELGNSLVTALFLYNLLLMTIYLRVYNQYFPLLVY